MFLCAFFLVTDPTSHLTSQCRTLFSAPILLLRLPHHMPVLVCPRVVGSFAASLGVAPATLLFFSSHSHLAAHLCQYANLACFKSITHRAGHQSVLLWPLGALIANFARDCSCKSSHLSPRLYFKDMLPLRLSAAHTLAAHPHPSVQLHSFRAVESSLLEIPLIHLQKKR